MKLIIPDYIKNYGLSPFKTNEEALKVGLEFGNGLKQNDDDYVVFWGYKPYIANYGAKYGIMETGFFNNGAFIDTVGNYQSLSLNTADGYRAVSEFELNGRPSARNIVFSLPEHKQSKYNADYTEIDITEWTGPILILQNPTDRSILNVTSKKKYLEFIDNACKFYGKKLFVKFHPWNSNEKFTELEDIVKPHGCQYGKASMRIIEKAEFCLAFNSTFAVDALLRNIPYVQYGMGTFFNAYGVIYSEGKFPTSAKRYGDEQQLPDFLIHKFCFNKNMEAVKYAKMIKHFANSKEMFPMTDEFSYANNI